LLNDDAENDCFSRTLMFAIKFERKDQYSTDSSIGTILELLLIEKADS